MGYLDSVANQIQVASFMGKPDSRATILFAAPPRAELLDREDRNIYPVGLLTSLNTQDTRSNIMQEVVGLSEMVPYGSQRGRKVGVATGLILFMQESATSKILTEGQAWTHFAKSLYRSLRESNPKLVLPFYKKSNQGDNSFFEPIAYNDEDKWRNFSSPFYNIPVGLYKLERSEGQKTLEATYYENVRFEGTMNASVTTSQAGPQFEQLAFTYTKSIPMAPDLDLVAQSAEGIDEANSSDLSSYLAELKSYLGVE
jgi:hypothetical protein